jgi:hypothetical protein
LNFIAPAAPALLDNEHVHTTTDEAGAAGEVTPEQLQ